MFVCICSYEFSINLTNIKQLSVSLKLVTSTFPVCKWPRSFTRIWLVLENERSRNWVNLIWIDHRRMRVPSQQGCCLRPQIPFHFKAWWKIRWKTLKTVLAKINSSWKSCARFESVSGSFRLGAHVKISNSATYNYIVKVTAAGDCWWPGDTGQGPLSSGSSQKRLC